MREFPAGPTNTMIDAIQSALNDKTPYKAGDSLAERVWDAVRRHAMSEPIVWATENDIEALRNAGNEDLSITVSSKREGNACIPLFVLPMGPPFSGRISRKLEWEGDGNDADPTWVSKCILGRYAVWMKGSNAIVAGPGFSEPTFAGKAIVDAMEAAQEKFNAILLTAITLTDDGPDRQEAK